MSKFWRQESTLRMSLIAIILVIVYSSILTPLGVFEAARLRTFDFFSNLTYQILGPPDQIGDIVLVSIDDESLVEIGKKWPWERSVFAEVVDGLSEAQPSLICLDVTFLGESSVDPGQDILLASSFERAQNVLLASYIDKKGKYIPPIALFNEAAWATGIINKPRDVDLKIRKAWALVTTLEYERDYSFGIKAVCGYLGIPPERIDFDGKNLIFRAEDSSKPIASDIRIPVKKIAQDLPTPPDFSARYITPLNFSARYGDFVSVPIWKVIRGEVPLEVFRDKIVIVGPTTEAAHDVHPTPLGLMPGMAIHANDILMLISGRFIHGLPAPITFLVLLVLAMAATLVTFRLSTSKGFFFTISLLAGFSGLVLLLSLQGHRLDWFGGILVVAVGYITVGFYKYAGLLFQSMSLKKFTITDTLTGLFTYRYFRVSLQLELSSAARSRRSLSLILISIDHFKELYDAHGFEQTNLTLKEIADILKSIFRKTDLLARYGSEEFCIGLPKTDYTTALAQAEKIKGEIEGCEFSGAEKPLEVTVSIGIASYPEVNAMTSGDLIKCADCALSRAKASGGNCVLPFDAKIDKVHLARYELPSKTPGLGELEYIAMDLEERNRELDFALRDLRGAQKVVEEAYLTVIQSLVKALEEKDSYTAGHSERVLKYSLILARKLNLSAKDLELIARAAPLHDVGKIGMPDRVLHKKGVLSEEELKISREHQMVGARILEPIKFLKDVAPLILHHHERYDGRGYPHGLSGDLIPVGAQVIAIADSFDAMTTGRGYNRTLSIEETIAELGKGAGGQFNPVYIEKFIEIIRSEGIGGAKPR